MNITRGQINETVVTVTERTTLTAPVYYLLEFKRELTNESFYCIAQNLSQDTDRYDQFDITETDMPNPLNAEITLEKGDYSYTIYQQDSAINLLPANTTASEFLPYVEIGKCTVTGSGNVNTEYDGKSTTNTYYEP
jgi:hypothetical protein